LARIEPNATEANVAAVREPLRRFEASVLPADNPRQVVAFARDSGMDIVGGVIAHTYHRTLIIDDLWVREDLRRQGLGTRLVQCAEDEAKRLDCCMAMTGTFESLGARPFFERIGYRVVSTSRDTPRGHTGYWFHKEFV
jgi:GNAT superfamily N-acetyltransferase